MARLKKIKIDNFAEYQRIKARYDALPKGHNLNTPESFALCRQVGRMMDATKLSQQSLEKVKKRESMIFEIQKLYQNGNTKQKIQEITGMSISYVQKCCRGVERIRLTDEEIARNEKYKRIVELIDSGMTYKQVEAEVGCTSVTVSRALRKAGR